MEKENKNFVKERFEFKLTINDNIVCQRFFKIDNYNENSKDSLDLLNTMRYCGQLIDNDLISKTRVYMHYTCPYIFNNNEEFNMWLNNNKLSLKLGDTIEIKSTPNIDYYWDGENMKPHKIKKQENDYSIIPEENSFLKLSFIDNGKEICSTGWDGRYYHKFIKNAIDLSNKRFNNNNIDPSTLSLKNSLIYNMCNGKDNLINTIIKELCNTCNKYNSHYSMLRRIKTK